MNHTLPSFKLLFLAQHKLGLVRTSLKSASANLCQFCLHSKARHFLLPPVPVQAPTHFIPALLLGPPAPLHKPLSNRNIKHSLIHIILINQHVFLQPVDKKTLGTRRVALGDPLSLSQGNPVSAQAGRLGCVLGRE